MVRWSHSALIGWVAVTFAIGCGEQAPDRSAGAAAGGATISGVATGDGEGDRGTFITDGSIDNGHPSVGTLQSGSASCSATLVGQRTVFTAGHCVPYRPVTFTVGGRTYTARQVIRHEGYGGGNTNDVAVVLLTDAPPVTPSTLNVDPVKVKQAITIVGFGVTSEGYTNFGTKRQAQNSISEVASTYFGFVGTGDVCNGDSGGPTFVTVGGQARIAGIHSTKAGMCGAGGYDMRVDVYRQWFSNAASGDLALPGSAPPPPPPPPPSTGVAEGGSCAQASCATGLSCVSVQDSSNGSLIGKYCMENCTQPGPNDPVCDAGETCVRARSGAAVCFNPNAPSQGFTTP